MKRLITFLSLMMISLNSFAKYHPIKGSYGDIAFSMMGPVDAIIYLLQVGCILCGVGMLVGAFFKFGAWRRNPVEVTVGVPVVMVIAGLALVVLGYLHYVTYV